MKIARIFPYGLKVIFRINCTICNVFSLINCTFFKVFILIICTYEYLITITSLKSRVAPKLHQNFILQKHTPEKWLKH